MVWALMVFASVTCLIYMLLAWKYDTTRLERRWERATMGTTSTSLGPVLSPYNEPGAEEAKPGFWARWQGRWGKVGTISPDGSLAIRLHRAGIPLKEGEFLAFNAFVGIVGGLLGVIIGGGQLSSTIMFFLMGLMLPQLYIMRQARRSMAALSGQIADSLVLMANSLRAGHSFMQSMEMVAREMSPPISREFRRALQEMNLGIPVETALVSMGERAGNDDLELLITAVLIQRQVGGNLAEILDTIAETVRERVRIHGEIKTLTAQGRISGIIISLLPLAIGGFIGVVNPTYITMLFEHPLGKVMVGIGISGQLLGVLAIRKIIRIDV
ncbi:MAG: secretion system protein [Firmicutes bacterium]|nr:secretion system protein [Bacillota bacterium]